MLAEPAVWGAPVDAPPAEVLPLGALLARLPRPASGEAMLRAATLDAALLDAGPPHKRGRACANGDSGDDGRIPGVPNEKGLSEMQVPVSTRV